MTSSKTLQDFIKQVESVGSLNSRFENLKCVNVTDSGRVGVISIVFTAQDIAEGVQVIVKFLDPQFLGHRYRLNAFYREPEILSILRNKSRCLQLVEGPNQFKWKIGDADLDVGYFVTEWLDHEVEV